MNDDGFGRLGFYILAVLYFFMGLGSLMSTAIINRFGTKFCLMQGGIGNTIWILSTILAAKQSTYKDDNFLETKTFTTVVLFVATIINGTSVGILWASANSYVASCASENDKGFFFGYYWSFYMMSQIFGNLIAAVILGKFN